MVDTETTGGNPLYSRIIEIGIIRIEPHCPPQFFSSLINPEGPVSTSVLELTGITQEELDCAPTFRELAQTIEEWLKDCQLVAHNARFDYGFLRYEFLRLGKEFSAPVICSVKLSRALYPQERLHNLDSIAQRFDIKIKRRHRALDDARAIWHFFDKAYRQNGKKFMNYFKKQSERRLAEHLPETLTDEIPETPGVFKFYGKKGEALYGAIGLNLREAVRNFFDTAGRNPRRHKVSEQTFDVETAGTAGELSARLELLEWIRFRKPVHHRISSDKKFKAEAWPFSSAIILEETDPFQNRSDYFLVDRWRFQGRVRTDLNLDENVPCDFEVPFFQGYLLLKKAIRGDFRSVRIRPLARGKLARYLTLSA